MGMIMQRIYVGHGIIMITAFVITNCEGIFITFCKSNEHSV